MNARNVTSSIALIGALVTASLLLYASRGSSSGSNLSIPVFAAWSLLPYLALYLCAKLGPLSGPWPTIVAVTGGLFTATTIYGYITGIFIDPDPQSGLMFMLLPAYQLLIALILLVISMALRRRT